jgi:hypothetical protein
MNNKKIIIKAAIIFSAIIMILPAGVNAEILPQTNDSAAVVNCQKKCATAAANNQCSTSAHCEKAVAVLNSSQMQAQNISAENAQINLNFKFSDNKATFVKAIDILLIGFSIVFVVMIIFIFVSTGIDKLFPYKGEEDD